MTPLGHAGLGVVLAHVDRRLPLAAVVVGAVLPDIDFALVWAPQFNAWHRVVTHNLAFVALTSLLIGVVWSRRHRALPWAYVSALALGGLSHLLVDACLDANASNGIGVAIGWPFRDAMWSPFNLLEPATGGPGWGDPTTALLGALRGLAWELPGIVLAAVLLWRRVRARRARA